MYDWKWSTFILLIGIAYFSTFLIYLAEKKGVKSNLANKKYNSFGLFCYLSTFVILVTFAVTRNVEMYPFGSIDMRYYIYQFQNLNIETIDWSLIFRLKQDEPFYYILIRFINFFTSNYRVYWLIVYSIVAFGMLKSLSTFINKNTNYWLLPIYFTIFFYGLSAVQTALSISFALIGLTYFKKSRTITSIFFLFISSMFHYISLALLPLILWIKVMPRIAKYSRRRIIFFMSSAFVVVFLFSSFISRILMFTKYHSYLDASLTIKGQLILIVLSVLTIIFFKPLNKIMNGENSLYIYIVLYNFLTVPYIIEFGIYRLNLYFLLFRIIVWSLLFKFITTKFFKRNERLTNFILNFILMVIGLVWFGKLIYDMKNIGIMPYFNEFI